MKPEPNVGQDVRQEEAKGGREELSMGEKAVRAFRRDLPGLLKERPRQWVAYHGDQCLGFAMTARELHRECIRRRLPDDEYIVRPIAPEPPDVIDNPYLTFPPPPKSTRTAGQ
jgi:hypothetical protein